MLVTILCVGLIMFVAHLVMGLILWLRVRKFYSYPGVFGFPIFGNIYYFYKTLFMLSIDGMQKFGLEMAAKYEKHGLFFHWIQGYKVMVTISSPEVLKIRIRTGEVERMDRNILCIINRMGSRMNSITVLLLIAGNLLVSTVEAKAKELALHKNLSGKPEAMYKGLIAYLGGPFACTDSDDSWKLKRKEYNIFLKRSLVDNNYYSSFIKCGNKLVELMLASSPAVDAHHKAIAISQDVAAETFFGIETSLAHDPNIISYTSKLSDLTSIMVGSPKLSKFIIDLLRPLETLVFGKLAELRKLLIHRASEKCPPEEKTLSMEIVSRIISSNESKKTLENAIHELFVSSTHTVTVVLSNSIVFLAVLPDIQEKAWQEQLEIFGNDDREPTIDDIEQMLFLDRFIKEVLRFSGPSFLGKFASGDIDINGVTIPQGACVGILLEYMKMNPKYWENPKAFEPDRFLEESDLVNYMYSPFGVGVRNCPGKHFATVLMKVILSKVLKRLKLRPVDNKIRFEDIRFKYSLMTEVASPPLIIAEERT